MRAAGRSRCNAIRAGVLVAAAAAGLHGVGNLAEGATAVPRPGASAATAADDAWRREMEERMADARAGERDAPQGGRERRRHQQAVAADAAARAPAVRDRFTLAPRGHHDAGRLRHAQVRRRGRRSPGRSRSRARTSRSRSAGSCRSTRSPTRNTIGSKDSFVVSSIPTSGESGGQTNFSARQTRLFVRTEAPTDAGAAGHATSKATSSAPTGRTSASATRTGEIGEKHQLLGRADVDDVHGRVGLPGDLRLPGPERHGPRPPADAPVHGPAARRPAVAGRGGGPEPGPVAGTARQTGIEIVALAGPDRQRPVDAGLGRTCSSRASCAS